MATAVGAGFDFSGLNKALKEADAKLQKFVRECDKAEGSVTRNFQNIANNGVNVLIKSLEQAANKMRELSKTVDSVNRVVSIISKLNISGQKKSVTGFSKEDAATVKRLEKEIERLRKTQDKTIRDVDKWKSKYESLSSSISKTERSTSSVVREHEKLDGVLGQIGRRIAAVFSVQSVIGYVNKIVEVRGEFEMQHKAMQVLIGDIDEANKLWDKTVELAVKSPYKVKDLVTYTKQLSAYRIETDKLYDKTKMLADIAAGLGVDMNRLILAYGQVKAANYLRGTELRQFSEAGINVLQELATYFSELEGRAVSVGDVFDMVSKRLVSFSDVDAVLQRVTSEGGTFYKMQEQQAETLRGMIMNLRDSIDLMMDSIGGANEDTIKSVINSVRELVDRWVDVYDAGKMWLKILSPIIATTLLVKTSNIGLSKALGDLVYSTSLGASAMMKYHKVIHNVEKTSKLGAKAISLLGRAMGGLVGIIGTVAIFKLVEGISKYYLAATEAERATKRLNEELGKIKDADLESLNKASEGYANLVARLEYANEGSEKRREIIQKINNEYGQYINYVVDENTEVQKLADSYEDVVRAMTEKHGLTTFEKGMEAIADSYGESLKNAKKEFFELLEYSRNSIQDINQIKIKTKDTGLLLIPSEKEINEIYSLIQQAARELNSQEIDSLEEQRKLLHQIVSEYYGESFSVSTDEVYSLDILDVLVKKKKAEEELQSEINALYGKTLKSREANLALSKLQLEYEEKRKDIELSSESKFERNKLLEELDALEEIAIIDLKVRFGLMESEPAEELKRKIKEWETPLTKSINDAISNAFSASYSEEDLSNVIISRTIQKEKGVSEYLKSIKSSWEQQNEIIAEQISLKDKGLSYDAELLTKAEKLEKLYRNVAEILGLELKYTEKLSEESRNAINSLLPEEYQISLEEGYSGIDNILANLKKKETEHLNVINQLNEQKKNGIPIDEERLRLAEEGYLWTKKTQDLLDSSAKTPIAADKVSSINSKLEEKYRLNAIEQGKDEVTLLNDANTAKQNAIAYQEQLLAMQTQGVSITQKELDLAKKDVEQLTLKWKLLGGIDKDTSKKKSDNLTDEQIRVIDNMNKKYRELKKTLTEDESIEGAFTAYKDAFEKAYSGTKFLQGKNIKKMTAEQFAEEVLNFPDRNDIVRFLDELAELPKELDDRIRIELAKGGHVEEMNVEEMQKEQEKMLQQIEDSFNNYEISLELDKLNIPSDLAKQLFGVDAISLDDIRSEIEAKLTDARIVGGQEDYVKELEGKLEKVKELEDKQLKERLKTYTEYLTKEQDTRVRMKLEELRKLEEVEELYKQGKYTQEQYATITGNIRRESAAEQAKQTWEDFAKTPYIVQMFDDLDKTSNKSLKLLNDHLQTLKTSLYNAGLPASELKEILDKINQVEKELEERNPFAQIGSGLKDLFTGNIDLTAARKAYDEQIKLQKQADDEVLAARERLFVWSEQNGKDNPTYNTLSAQLEDAKKKAYELQKTTDEVTENFQNAQRKVLGMAEGLSTVLGYAQQLSSAFGDMADKLGIMSEEEQAILNSAMNVVGDVANIGMAAAQIAANPTNPAAWVQGISSVMSLIGNIAATGDAAREKEIQAEMKKIDRLERAYEKLEKAMEEAYTIDQMRANKASMEQNIDAQIKALESANAKEEAMKKKDQDQIDANYEKIAELEEKKAELQRETVERLGGTYDYASVAEQFLDAWLEAFKETGDGLSGLEDNFDEFFSDLAKKQLIYGGLTTIIENLQKKINADLSDNQRIDNWGAIIDEYNQTITNIDEFLTGVVSNLKSAGLDIFSGDGSELSGLSKGIQGMSEQTAGVLEAYWNAVRFDVSAIRQRFDEYMASQGFVEDTNPMLSQLQTIADNTASIHTLLASVFGTSDSGAEGIRVFVKNWK